MSWKSIQPSLGQSIHSKLKKLYRSVEKERTVDFLAGKIETQREIVSYDQLLADSCFLFFLFFFSWLMNTSNLVLVPATL